MSQIGAPVGLDPALIGEVAAPPFARLPDPATLFAARAARLRALAPDHALGPYLDFLAGIAEAQHAVQPKLPAPVLPPADQLARAREFGMPALDRPALLDQPACAETVRRTLAEAAWLEMPPFAREALGRVAGADDATLRAMAGNVLDNQVPFDSVAEHALVAAGLQVHAARTAALLDAKALVPVAQGACPTCGGPPGASVVVGWDGASGARYCVCALCATMWNHVRIRCVACGTGKGISYQEVEGSDGTIKAECCGECRTYLKIFYQVKNPALDPVADDIASSALDLLVAESGVRRSGVNPFLLGY